MNEAVILLHGLWLRSEAMAFLARKIAAAGFDARTVDYSSVHDGLDAAGERLRASIRACAGRRVHLVGHSLGGLIAATVVQRDPGLLDGRIVCLGSPLRGSAAGRALKALPGGRSLLGSSVEFLERGLERWDAPQQLGAIAGRLPIGLGMLLGGLHGPSDGTVAVEETRLPGIADHRVIAAAHTGLPFCDEGARQTVAFLRDGRFA